MAEKKQSKFWTTIQLIIALPVLLLAFLSIFQMSLMIAQYERGDIEEFVQEQGYSISRTGGASFDGVWLFRATNDCPWPTIGQYYMVVKYPNGEYRKIIVTTAWPFRGPRIVEKDWEIY